jgi:hypothetical protein
MHPDLGRFMQPDPIGFAADASNLYRYCGNNPANLTDPFGLETPEQFGSGDPVAQTDKVVVTGQAVPGLNPLQFMLWNQIINGGSPGGGGGGGLSAIIYLIKNANGTKIAGFYFPPDESESAEPITTYTADDPSPAVDSSPAQTATAATAPAPSAPPNPGGSAIARALGLGIDTAAGRTNVGGRPGAYFTHYGPGTRIGGWDPTNDSGTNRGVGNHENPLNPNSLAISEDVAQRFGLQRGGPVYANGQYLGNYDDTPGFPNTIDVYDPTNAVNSVNWGGMLWNANISNHP